MVEFQDAPNQRTFKFFSPCFLIYQQRVCTPNLCNYKESVPCKQWMSIVVGKRLFICEAYLQKVSRLVYELFPRFNRHSWEIITNVWREFKTQSCILSLMEFKEKNYRLTTLSVTTTIFICELPNVRPQNTKIQK